MRARVVDRVERAIDIKHADALSIQRHHFGRAWAKFFNRADFHKRHGLLPLEKLPV